MDDMAETVATCGSTHVMHHQGATDHLLITFNDAGSAKRFDGSTYWAKKYAEKNNVSTLGVITDGARWFPPDEMMDVRDQVAPILSRYRNIVCYGFSMGAYGALKFSRAFGATHVISVAPQFSIDPKVMGSLDKRFLRSFNNTGGHKIEEGDVHGRCWIVFDEHFEEDRINASLIRSVSPDVHFIKTPYLMHNVMFALSSSATANGLIAAILHDDAPSARTIVRAGRRSSPIYHYTIALTATQNHPRAVVKALRHPEAKDRLGGGLPYYHVLCRALIRAGLTEEAYSTAAALFERTSHAFTNYHRRIVGEFLSAGLVSQAQQVFAFSKAPADNRFRALVKGQLDQAAARRKAAG